jgi:hypothetical protein
MSSRLGLIVTGIVALILVILAGFYIFSFEGSNGGYLKSVQTPKQFNGEVIWHEATTTIPWPKRDAPATWVANGKLYLAGGIDGETNTTGSYVEYWKLPHFNDIWSTTDGEHWIEEVKHAEWTPRRSISIIPFKGKYFLYGGWSPVGGYKTDIWQSADGLTWSKATVTPPWVGREGQAVINHQGKLFFIGGVNFDKRQEFNDVWASDDGLNWTEIASTTPWSLRYDQAVESWNGYIWLSGGVHLGGKSGESDVWRSADGLNWEQVVNNAPWGERHGFALFGWREHLWLVSGWNIAGDFGNRDVWYSADGSNWLQSGSTTPWEGREDHAVNILNDKLIFFTGMKTGYKWTNDVWLGELAR